MKNKYNIRPHEIMFFDDDRKNIDGAKTFGIDAHFYDDFAGFEAIVKSAI